MDTMFYKWSYVLVRVLEMIKACYYPDLCVSVGGGGGTRAKRGEVERRAKPPSSSQACSSGEANRK